MSNRSRTNNRRRSPRARTDGSIARRATGVSGDQAISDEPATIGEGLSYEQTPELQLIYDTAPVGLAFLTSDCRYVQVNARLTDICGLSVADHIGRSVRETVPQLASQVEAIVRAVLRSGEPVTGVEIRGQRPDKRNAEHIWITNWHPVRNRDGAIMGINVVAEEITERRRAEALLAAKDRALRDNEARLRELADNISQFAWTADSTGSIYWYNKRWYDYTGTTLDEVRDWGWKKVHHPEHVDRVVQRIQASFATGTPWEDTFPLRARDGSYRWFLSRALPICNETGEVIRWFGTHTDITDQIDAEKALRELNKQLEERVEAQTRERLNIWDVSQDLHAVIDLKGKLLSVNPEWTAALGWSQSELLHKPSDWLVHPDDRDKTRSEINHLAAGGKTIGFENRIFHKDGSYHWIYWKAVPDRGLIYATGRDITDLKQAASALREVQRDLERVTRQTTLAALTASIAHEINQPLAAIVTNAHSGLRWLARTEPDLNEVAAALKRIATDGRRASEVIASIRGMFRDDGEKLAIDLNALLNETLGLIQVELERHHIEVRQEVPGSTPNIMANRVQLQQVFLNLLMNAIEAMSSVDDRERLLVITFNTDERRNVVIAIRDSGVGIDPKDSQRIFEAFFTTKVQGMGMGLYICKSIVEAHGGRLWALPGTCSGTVVNVELPISDLAPEPEPAGAGRSVGVQHGTDR